MVLTMSGRRRFSRAVLVLVPVTILVGEAARGPSDGTPARAVRAENVSTSRPHGVVVRKDVKDLTRREKADFIAAIKKLKSSPPPRDDPRVANLYDHFVATHVSKMVCWSDPGPEQGAYAHIGPDTVTWHRQFLLDFEHALSEAAGKPVAIPYWDFTSEESTAAMFADDFMGPGGDKADDYVVTSGPFRKGQWRLNVKGFYDTNPGQSDWLVRAVATESSADHLQTPEYVCFVLGRPSYDVAPWNLSSDPQQSFRQAWDGTSPNPQTCQKGIVTGLGEPVGGEWSGHIWGHHYVGGENLEGQPGSMTDVTTSPNDPIFWLHHANLDRIAEGWWKTHGYQYLPGRQGPRGYKIDDALWPYHSTNGDMAVPTQKLGYVYEQKKCNCAADLLDNDNVTQVAFEPNPFTWTCSI